MTETGQNQENAGIRDEKGRFLPGVSGNPEGKPLGTKKEKAFTEYFDEICEEIAIANKMSVDDVKKVIYKVGYAKAKEGNYQFYKDILDRIHGQAKGSIDITSKGESINPEIKARTDEVINTFLNGYTKDNNTESRPERT